MSFAAILLLAVGLAADAAAVSAGRGMMVARLRPAHFLSVALFFGVSQAVMPLFGWALGASVGERVKAWDHWIAFVLLAGLGAKMLWEARHGADEPEEPTPANPFDLGIMVLLAIATSLDALAVGITLPMLHAPMLLSIATIGIVTAVLSMVALWAGRRFGDALGARLEVAGGLVLIGIGTKILIEHLVAG